MTDGPRVSVLLATRNGAAFLPKQLESIARSEGVDWRVWASDDGSTDRTLDILAAARDRWSRGRLTVVPGPRAGTSANFAALLCRPEVEGDCFAFADQDDEWEPAKLSRAARWLATVPETTPALYCSRARLVDRDGRELGLSPLFVRPPAFANALTQNLASGNTMVVNRAARDLLVATAESMCEAAAHDWWAYLIVTGVGGVVRYDREPMVRYRQHGGNQIGGAVGVLGRAANGAEMIRGRFHDWNTRNLSALARVSDRLTPEHRRTLEAFAATRNGTVFARVAALARSGVYRQTIRGNALIGLSAVFNRL